jgi:hypothetical protein
MELIEFFEDIYDYKLSALKEFVENKEKKTRLRMRNAPCNVSDNICNVNPERIDRF